MNHHFSLADINLHEQIKPERKIARLMMFHLLKMDAGVLILSSNESWTKTSNVESKSWSECIKLTKRIKID